MASNADPGPRIQLNAHAPEYRLPDEKYDPERDDAQPDDRHGGGRA